MIRRVGADGQVHEIGGLFEGRGAVRDVKEFVVLIMLVRAGPGSISIGADAR